MIMQAYPPLPYKQKATHWVVFQLMLSGRQDSNLRLSGPKPDALTGLRYTPKSFNGAKVAKSIEKTKSVYPSISFSMIAQTKKKRGLSSSLFSTRSRCLGMVIC